MALAGLSLGSACDKSEASQTQDQERAALQAKYTVKSDDVDLKATVELLERSDVRDAEAVEALINAEDSPLVLDVDEDGERDFIQVHEVELDGQERKQDHEEGTPDATKIEVDAKNTVELEVEDGSKAAFELRVVPSSQVDAGEDSEAVAVDTDDVVVVATIELEVDVEAEAVVVEAAYAPVVVVAEGHEPTYVHRIHIQEHHDHHIVVAAPFVAWVWVDHRPIYVGHVHLPPGHAKKLGLHWHGHHGHHVKVKHRGHGHHGKTHVKVKHKGHGGKTHVKVKHKGHGGRGHGKGKF